MLKSLTQQEPQQELQQHIQQQEELPVYQASIPSKNENANRSARRQAILREKKQEMKEQKKYHKSTDNSGKFNPKKSRKVSPLNPSASMRRAYIEKKTTLAPELMVTLIEHTLHSEQIETLEEESDKFVQQEEDLHQITEAHSSIEENCFPGKKWAFIEIEIEEEAVTAKEDLSHPVVEAKEDILSVIEENNSNEVEINNDADDKNGETAAIATVTMQEIKEPESLKDIKTPEPSMSSSSFDEDKISPSTSCSSNKKKANLITRLFKHKNTSKKVTPSSYVRWLHVLIKTY
jgi:predicted secreted protein